MRAKAPRVTAASRLPVCPASIPPSVMAVCTAVLLALPSAAAGMASMDTAMLTASKSARKRFS